METTLFYGLNSINIYNKDIEKIRKRIIYLGILNLILSPFILIYNIISFIFLNIDELYINKKVLGPRRYTLYFKWKMRQYNELEHHFNNRINKSMKHSIEYTKQFPSLFTENIAKFVSLLSGGFIVFFLLLSVLDENILLYVTFLNRSLIFYTGLFATLSAICKSFILEPENSAFDPNKVMENIIKETGHDPGYWKNNAHKLDIRDEFLEHFKYIIVLFFYDILSVITTPYLLIYVVSNQANIINNFLSHNTSYKYNIGYICTLSEFKRNTENNQKLENSILCFSGNYPDWDFD
jgi:autophagy-related protein 9